MVLNPKTRVSLSVNLITFYNIRYIHLVRINPNAETLKWMNIHWPFADLWKNPTRAASKINKIVIKIMQYNSNIILKKHFKYCNPVAILKTN